MILVLVLCPKSTSSPCVLPFRATPQLVTFAPGRTEQFRVCALRAGDVTTVFAGWVFHKRPAQKCPEALDIMPLFGKSQKSPAELAKTLRDAMEVLKRKDLPDKKTEKASDEASKTLVAMKHILYGTGDQEPVTELVAQLAQEMYNSDMIITLINNLHKIDFEGKKDVAQIFSNILRRQIGTRSPTVEYICTRQEILFTLMRGNETPEIALNCGIMLRDYETPEIALNCGIMLRECVRHEALAKVMLHSNQFYDFFRYVEMSTFDLASDAFATFKDLLTKHKILCAEFLEQNYDKVFGHYQQLLTSENYVTKRQSLKLLGELLLDRHNFTTMTKYISNADNLKLMMNLLRDKSRNIQFEAFHVFKVFVASSNKSILLKNQAKLVFVANPNKSKPILDILLKNQAKLVEFLTGFHTDRTEDEQFNDEKAYLIKQIRELQPAPQGV
ncbi:CAB39 [Branchiostoma lanceolatum]|uniref:CAB39 protein n=1 Tax=Branchiostoma lanceolatum TaxID=7740 RepID=A0A8J9Z134_BRALA|nr:CAB39 [Branchiostoma lanceolatum]